MTIRYEANPPKFSPDKNKDELIQRFIEKIKIVSKKCNAIHITENVLGYKRLSAIQMGAMIKKEIPNLPITVSMRVRDKDEKEIDKFVDACINYNFSGILAVMGDPLKVKTRDSNQIPSQTIQRLQSQGIGSKIDLYLSISNKPDFTKITKKINAKPKGFMTQVVQDISQVEQLVENLKGFSVIPIILFPSQKNQKSAEFLGLDLSQYDKEFQKFVKKAHEITGDILITSPNDFNGLVEFLEKSSI